MADKENTMIVSVNNLNNSNRARREAEEKELPEERTTKVNIRARAKKETVGQKLKRAFFGENVENVGEYMIFDVGIPALKATMADMFSNGLEVLLFGESRGRGKRDGYRSYSSASLARGDRDRRESYSSRRAMRYDDFLFDNAKDANYFLAEVLDYVKEYDRISLAVYISILQRYCDEKIETSWKDDRVGWYLDDFRRVEPTRCGRDGWEIRLPRPERI